VLRYLTDAYRGLVQSVPEDSKTDELVDITEWLGELVRQVDSSLLDEWEALAHPEPTLEALELVAARPAANAGPAPAAVTANTRAFTVMIRNSAFRRVELLARRDFDALGELDGPAGWDAARWRQAARAYFAEHDNLGIGAEARSGALFDCSAQGRNWNVTQTLDDPAGHREWVLRLEADFDASDAAGEAVLTMTGFVRL
jgi:hypothetical protein